MECKLNPFLYMIDNYHLCTIIFSFVLASLFKDRRWLILTGITSFNYYVTFSTLCYFADHDAEKVWRYFIWISWEALWMVVIFKAWDRKLVYQYQAVAVIGLGFAGNFLQTFRHIDRHYFELAYSTSIYETMAPTLNNLLVLVCLHPLINYSRKGMAQWRSR